MSEDFNRFPLLDRIYQQFLNDEDSASFIQSVAKSYGLGTLERLARYGHRVSRRASILAIGFMGDFRFNETLGRALHDSDRAVRLLSDHGIRELWMRDGDGQQRHMLRQIARLNTRHRLVDSLELADELIAINPNIAETWNQRAISKYGLELYDEAIEDCREALYLNRFHFNSALGIANCFLQMEDAFVALEFFRTALSINPDLESVRGQITQLERSLDS